MDPSALIFIVLALAWVAYLVPKALEHHEESARSRSISTFSERMRILARREPTSRRHTELVTRDDRPAPPPEPVLSRRERRAARRRVSVTPQERRALLRAVPAAARRRRRVLDVLGVCVVVVAALAILGVLAWHWLLVPAALVLVWLVLCRRSVRRAHRLLALPVVEAPVSIDPAPLEQEVAPASPLVEQGAAPAPSVVETPPAPALPPVEQGAAPAPSVVETPPAPGWWDLQPLHVPTYVAKAPARREVRTIDLDSTGVWSSGRNEADSALVREAEADEASDVAREAVADEQPRRAAGD